MIRYFLIIATTMLGGSLWAQDGPFDLSLTINTQQVTTVDPKIFNTLKGELLAFLTSHSWTEDHFEPEERIRANFVLTVSEGESPNNFKAELAIQSTRPVYGTGEETRLFNYLDKKFNFYYEQFQGVQLSENSYTGNLPSVFGYYCYLILGYDYDTFSLLGGQPYFEKAQEILNRLPSDVASGDPGWYTQRSRNRFWLLENILSPRCLPLRRAMYTYHREGLDLMASSINQGRTNCLIAIEDVQVANQAYPGTIFVQTFIDAKRDEIIELFKGAPPAEKQSAIQIMSRIDPSNSGRYRSIRSRGAANTHRRSLSRVPTASPKRG